MEDKIPRARSRACPGSCSASLLPLASFALGTGSLMLSGLQLGMIPASKTRSVALVQAAYPLPASPTA